MNSMRQIEGLRCCIADESHLRRIVLFGSYARGKPTQDLDVDLQVIMPFESRSATQRLAGLVRKC